MNPSATTESPIVRLIGWWIERPLYVVILMLACVWGGYWGMNNIGRLEDPPFPMPWAYIITPYPGASAQEVEQEVTDVVETSLQELPYLQQMKSKSVPGRSEIQIEIDERLDSSEIPQVWDEMRRRVSEARAYLPPGAMEPLVEDDFGDVYGIYYAVTADGFSPRQIHDLARRLSDTALSVPGVAKVSLSGQVQEAVYLEFDHQALVRLGIPLNAVIDRLNREISVGSAPAIDLENRRATFHISNPFRSIESLEEIRIGLPGQADTLRLGDVARVTRQPVDQPFDFIRFNGVESITFGVSVRQGENVVDVGYKVDQALEQLLETEPIGIALHPIYRQHVMVEQAIGTFLTNLSISIATVIGVLCIFMGWRAGAVVGSVLLLTVGGTVAVMALADISLQRISLGAMMIAMGMLVDNAIVVVEGMLVGVQMGMKPVEAAKRAVSRTQFPLLGATVIGILAFAPIGLSNDASGHFLVSLFQVVAISLMLSWLLAVLVTPLLGQWLLKPQAAQDEDVIYGGLMYRPYRWLVSAGLRRAWFGMLIVIGITGTSIWGFGKVKQSFFPTNNTPIYFVDVYLPQGSTIHATRARVEQFRQAVNEFDGIVSSLELIGRGPSRFSATLRPEQPNPAYAHLLVRVNDVRVMGDIMEQTRVLAARTFPDLEILVRRSEFGPSGPYKMEARLTGPDNRKLRELGESVLTVYERNGFSDLTLDWRQPALTVVPRYDAARAAEAGISRSDIYQALSFGTDGIRVGVFRDRDMMLPIIVRAPESERNDLQRVRDRTVFSPALGAFIPMRQVIDGFDLSTEETMLRRLDRIPTLTAQANQPLGENFDAAFNRVRDDIEAIPLPEGYSLTWGGEVESSERARAYLGAKVPLAFGSMFLVTLLLFGRFKQALIIWLTVPMTVCGVVVSLLITDLSFTFPSSLGFLSLAGMLIKNCVVLVDEIDQRVRVLGMTHDAITRAAISRLRPVILAAGTTIFGMTPLISDAFFMEMAVCIMGGLALSTLLIMFAIPLLYWLIKPAPSLSQG